MSWVTAIMEAVTIQGFPYYVIRDRSYMYTVGAIVYGIYFLVSFPAFARLDEDVRFPSASTAGPGKVPGPLPVKRLQPNDVKGLWTMGEAVSDSLACAMAVTLLLDFWRLFYVWAAEAWHGADAAAGGMLASILEQARLGLPWMLSAYGRQ